MRMLSGFLALSGVVWLAGLVGLDALDGNEQTWLLSLATWGTPVVVAGTLATFFARNTRHVVVMLVGLWLLTVTVWFFFLSAMFEPSLIIANAALLSVSIPYVAWLMFPLVAISYRRGGARD